MRVVTFKEHGGIENLSLEAWPNPEPGPGEALVQVRAIAFNGFDPMILRKTTALKTPLPMIPCGDAAGEIVAFGGSETHCFAVGDRVSIVPFGDFGMMGETALGVARELIAVPLANLLKIPDGVSFEQAAALPIAYGTAYRMVGERGDIRPGETVLILGAGGGVGVAALQLCKARGARVIACASGAWKLERLKALGADEVVDTSESDFVAAVQALVGRPRVSGAGGVDVVINYVGGDTWEKSFRVLKLDGRLLICGASAGYATTIDLRYVWSFEHRVIGSNGWTKDDQGSLLDLVARGALDPVLHAVRPLEEFPTAMAEMEGRGVLGKSIITLGAVA